jgi:hypothetical protein
MQEIHFKIRFNQPCLGNVRAKNMNKMLRDPDGRVMFLPTWWQSIITYAAQLLNVPSDLAKKIDWDPVVDGATQIHRRFYEPGKCTLHEAFLPGDVVGINCVIPDGMSINVFRELVDAAGRYRGVCPYKPEKKQGTFDVVDVQPHIRAACLEISK